MTFTPRPIPCAGCGRSIDADRVHFLLDDLRVLCGPCVASRGLHHRLKPGCQRAHDTCSAMTDHTIRASDRATIAALRAARQAQRTTTREATP